MKIVLEYRLQGIFIKYLTFVCGKCSSYQVFSNVPNITKIRLATLSNCSQCKLAVK